MILENQRLKAEVEALQKSAGKAPANNGGERVEDGKSQSQYWQ